MAVALQWASSVMAISIAMVLPGLLGLWADSRLGTKVLFTVLGFGFGVVSGIWQLVRITAPREFDGREDKTNQDKTNQNGANQNGGGPARDKTDP